MKISLVVTLLFSGLIYCQMPKVTSGKIEHFDNFKSSFVDVRNIDVWLPDDYSEEEKKQLYIANVEKPTYPMYQFTRKKDSSFFTTTKILGKYALRSDTLKPSVSLVHFKDKQWISRLNTLKVKISDKGSGIKDYRATIDGEWILMEYNHRKKIATYNFNDKKLVGSKHIFKLVVYDNVGNTNTYQSTFYRK